MYCVKCGVKLADSEKICPLCQTTAFHPEITRQECKKMYPADAKAQQERVSMSGFMFIITSLVLLSVVVMILCDVWVNKEIIWSGIASGGLLLAYVIIMLPMWFYSPNPVIFISADFSAIAFYLLYINIALDGNWFLSFAFPLIAGIALIVCSVVALLRYLKRGRLYIFGGALIISGAFMLLVEYLLNYTFGISEAFFWSFFPLSAGTILGLTLIIIAICPSLKESLRKKFFI